MDIILYEDETVSDLAPITLTRAAYDIRTAGFTLREAVDVTFSKSKRGLFLNARLAPSLVTLSAISDILKRTDEECVFVTNGKLIGVFSASGDARARAETIAVRHEIDATLLEHPEDIIFFNKDSLKDNVRIAAKKKSVVVGRGTTLPKQCVCDTTHGPIVIGENVTIAPFVVLKGPLSIGDGCVIKEFSVIESSTIGPVCKVGGEISGSVIDGYSNKQHHGHLGDSYIGRWVNLAAGTTVSNLKNTYSNITIDGRDSGSQFLGTVMGDYAKMGSNSSIFPGKVVGVAANLFGMVTSDVPSFTTYVSPGKLYELPLSVAEKGQKAMAERRGIVWTEADSTRLEKIFERTASEREAKNVSKEKLTF